MEGLAVRSEAGAKRRGTEQPDRRRTPGQRRISMHTGYLHFRVLVSCIFLFAWTGAQAQLLTAKPDSIYSNILKQNRPVEVYLPKEFEKDAAQRYETLYVLD